MHIIDVRIREHSDFAIVEQEICRLLRCNGGKCASLYTEAFLPFKTDVLQATTRPSYTAHRECRVEMPEGLLLVKTISRGMVYVNFSWVYAIENDSNDDLLRLFRDPVQGSHQSM